MADLEKTIVPLDAAHEILAAFGILPTNKAYQRWRRDDGFRLTDFLDVLCESRFLLVVDWREWLQDAMNIILDQLSAIGALPGLELGEGGEEGYLEVDGKRAWIKYVPTDDDNFVNVIRSINLLIHPAGQYRKLRSCEGTDGWIYGLLANNDWKELESSVSELVNLVFLPVDSIRSEGKL
jgi:hypothetical protein